MLINLKKTKFYYLTTNTNINRVKHIEDILKIYDLTQVNPQIASRVGYKTDESGNKIRVFKKLLSTK